MPHATSARAAEANLVIVFMGFLYADTFGLTCAFLLAMLSRKCARLAPGSCRERAAPGAGSERTQNPFGAALDGFPWGGWRFPLGAAGVLGYFSSRLAGSPRSVRCWVDPRPGLSALLRQFT